METVNIDQLPPEIQKQIKGQMILNRINAYGQKIKEVDGKKYVDNGLYGYEKIRIITDFKELEQGCLTFLGEEKYPMRGHFPVGKTDTLTRFKKMIPTLIKTLQGNVFNKLIALIYLRINWKHFVYFIHRGMRDLFMEPRYYSQPVLAVYNAIKNGEVRDIVCAVLEYDMAYRYRFQDIVSELNKYHFRQNPAKELQRLADLYFKREINGAAIKSYEKAVRVALFFLKFNRKLLRELKQIVEELDIAEIKPSIEDTYWMNGRYEEYNFFGRPFVERVKDYEKELATI